MKVLVIRRGVCEVLDVDLEGLRSPARDKGGEYWRGFNDGWGGAVVTIEEMVGDGGAQDTQENKANKT